MFKPKKDKHSQFWTNKDIDVVKLDKEIKLTLEVERWEDSPTKEGYSGISVQSDHHGTEKDRQKKHLIVVHWTLDGKEGFNIDFPPDLFGKITSTIASHKADNPLKPREESEK